MKEPYVINRYVKFSETSLIDSDEVFHQKISLSAAKDMAKDSDLSLVCFNEPQGKKLALCKIIDYGKWKYHNSKEKRKIKQNSKREIKEIKFSPVIDTGDLTHKVNQVIDFLKRGDEVIISMRFKGRQRRMYSAGEKALEEIAEMCKDYGTEHHRKKNATNIAIRLIKQ